MSSIVKRISAETVVKAIQALQRDPTDRTGRSRLPGYLALKAMQPSRGAEVQIASEGQHSAMSTLDRFFLLAPGEPLPYLNPFGLSEGEPDWTPKGWQRRGVYTHLYGNRTLERILTVRKLQPSTRGDPGFAVRIPATAGAQIASDLGRKLPLDPTAAFLLRHEGFSDKADRKELAKRFQDIFHFTQAEMDALFQPDPTFPLEFDHVGFTDALSSLPASLHPRPPTPAHAATAQVAPKVSLAKSRSVDLVMEDRVLRRARRALAVGPAVALVGPPGTGKSQMVDLLTEEAQKDPDSFNLSAPPVFDRYTAETDWTARAVIGGHYPQADGTLRFQEGYLLAAIRGNRWLVIDEMNRAYLDRVLGAILTFLARQNVDIGWTDLTDKRKQIRLVWGNEPESGVVEDDNQCLYVAGKDWRVIGTYNSVDVGRVFAMGAALSRRWATVPVPPLPATRLREVLDQFQGVPSGVTATLVDVYSLHEGVLPIGPAPFIDMARYTISEEASASRAAGAAPTGVSKDERQLLCDAYVLYMGPQLQRIDPSQREAFLTKLGDVLGRDLADELRSP